MLYGDITIDLPSAWNDC